MVTICLSAALLSYSATAGAPPDWEKTVTTLPRGDFPNPRPLVATYNFGWSGVVAATGEFRFGKIGEQLQLQAAGQTIGIVRSLWKFDTRYRALANATTLRPIAMHQVDELRRKTVITDLVFKPGRVERLRIDSKSDKPAAPKIFSFPEGIFDLHSALLYVRSQPLHEGDVYRLVVYPATNAYLTTLTVVGHSTLTTAAGVYPAIKVDVQLKKIGKNNDLEPHKKFRHASIFVSDDADRLLLRIEASIFVGTIFAELQSVRFPNEKQQTGPAPNENRNGRHPSA
ncbi:MAG: DUF3108 domain-containing protein [Chthoniobacterales bacterium]